MKKIVISILVGGLLTSLALAQPASPSRFGGRRGFSKHQGIRTVQASAPGKPSLLIYAITIGFQFGAIDLRSGAFLPIGPGLPPDVGDGLIQGPGRSLLSLGFEGNLTAIDPSTGLTSLVGSTGLTTVRPRHLPAVRIPPTGLVLSRASTTSRTSPITCTRWTRRRAPPN
jgi:hypothetical protein